MIIFNKQPIQLGNTPSFCKTNKDHLFEKTHKIHTPYNDPKELLNTLQFVLY